MILPVMYDKLSIHEKRLVREEYTKPCVIYLGD